MPQVFGVPLAFLIAPAGWLMLCTGIGKYLRWRDS